MWSSQRILIKISGNNGCLAPVLFMYSNHFTIIKKYNFDNKNGIYFFLDLTQFPNFEWWYWIEKHIFLCLSFINIIPMWHPIVDYTSFDNLRSKFFFCSNPTERCRWMARCHRTRWSLDSSDGLQSSTRSFGLLDSTSLIS